MSAALPPLEKVRIGIIGLGYVGLPLAVEFGKHFPTVGFDIKPDRVAALKQGRDVTRETTPEELRAATHLTYTTDKNALRECNVFIVTVPVRYSVTNARRTSTVDTPCHGIAILLRAVAQC